jgi:hypothetical protein
MSNFTVYYYCPSCNYKALQIEIVADSDGTVQSYACRCLTCGYSYASDGRESGGRGTYKLDGDNPDCYPDDPTPETVEAWACRQDARGIIVNLATCLDGKGSLVFVRGEPPDWVGRNPMDFGYVLRRVAIFCGECLPCKLDDPQRAGWAIFSLVNDGSLGERELFGNDLLAVTNALEPPID